MRVAAILNERVQKVQRYSFQRPFSEVYRLRKTQRDTIAYQVRTSEGYAVQPENLSGKKLTLRRR